MDALILESFLILKPSVAGAAVPTFGDGRMRARA